MLQRPVAGGAALIESIGERFRPSGEGLKIERRRARVHVRTARRTSTAEPLRVRIALGNELGAFVEVPEDRVRLSERPAVAEDERLNAQCWIEAAEDPGAIGAVDNIHRSAVGMPRCARSSRTL